MFPRTLLVNVNYFAWIYVPIFIACLDAFRLYFVIVPPGAALPELEQSSDWQKAISQARLQKWGSYPKQRNQRSVRRGEKPWPARHHPRAASAGETRKDCNPPLSPRGGLFPPPCLPKPQQLKGSPRGCPK